MNKKELRKKMLAEREKLDKNIVNSLSAKIRSRIIDMDVFRDANNICLYIPIKNEVDIFSLFNGIISSDKHVWLPRVHGDTMDFYYYDDNVILESGSYGIPEPQSHTALEPDCRTLIIMPGAVFSENGDRIGYGGGYYDRYLSKHPMCQTIAVCYDFQILPDISSDKYDIKPNCIVSEKQIIFIKGCKCTLD